MYKHEQEFREAVESLICKEITLPEFLAALGLFYATEETMIAETIQTAQSQVREMHERMRKMSVKNRKPNG